MPVSTSLSASSLNDHTGARTGLASLTSGVIVLLTLLVLARSSRFCRSPCSPA
jgi:SulP family sulfate permease